MWLNRLTTNCSRLFGLYWDFRLEAEGDGIPENTPLILAPNHASYLDPWFIIWMIRTPMQHLITRNWYERSLFWEAFFRANGTVPVSTNDPNETLEAVRAVLDKNRPICIFPEGKVSEDGTLQRFHPGIAWFATVTGVPVVPIGIVGAYESLPKHSKFPKRGTITIRCGRPMRYPNPGPAPNHRETIAFVKEVRKEVARLIGQS